MGHYEILDLMGEGGMGAVYKARNMRLGRPAALKIMRPDRAGDAEQKRRFMQQAQPASTYNHPHTLTIYEIDARAGPDYTVMKFVTVLVSGLLRRRAAARGVRAIHLLRHACARA